MILQLFYFHMPVKWFIHKFRGSIFSLCLSLCEYQVSLMVIVTFIHYFSTFISLFLSLIFRLGPQDTDYTIFEKYGLPLQNFDSIQIWSTPLCYYSPTTKTFSSKEQSKANGYYPPPQKLWPQGVQIFMPGPRFLSVVHWKS